MSKEKSSKAKKQFLSVIKFLLLVTICVVASIAIVWPLWKFSTSAPSVYTILMLVLLAAGLIYLIIKKIKKSHWYSVVRFLINALIICGGLCLTVRNVLFEKKLFALIFFIASIILLVIFNLIMNKVRHE